MLEERICTIHNLFLRPSNELFLYSKINHVITKFTTRFYSMLSGHKIIFKVTFYTITCDFLGFTSKITVRYCSVFTYVTCTPFLLRLCYVRLEYGFWYNFENTLSINLILCVTCMMQNSKYVTNCACT